MPTGWGEGRTEGEQLDEQERWRRHYFVLHLVGVKIKEAIQMLFKTYEELCLAVLMSDIFTILDLNHRVYNTEQDFALKQCLL